MPLGELLGPGFLAKHTRLMSEDEMFEASGFKVDTAEDFENIPDEEWNDFIEQNTPFATWSVAVVPLIVPMPIDVPPS